MLLEIETGREQDGVMGCCQLCPDVSDRIKEHGDRRVVSIIIGKRIIFMCFKCLREFIREVKQVSDGLCS